MLTITFHLSSDAKPFAGAEAFSGIQNKGALLFCKAMYKALASG